MISCAKCFCTLRTGLGAAWPRQQIEASIITWLRSSRVVWSHTSAKEIAFRRGDTNPSQGGVEADGHRPVLAGRELIQVPATTLDEFIAAGNPPPQLVKIDVEGGESEVLSGARALFTARRPLLIVEVHHQPACESLQTWLAESRYSGRWQVPPESFPRYLLAWPAERSQPFNARNEPFTD